MAVFKLHISFTIPAVHGRHLNNAESKDTIGDVIAPMACGIIVAIQTPEIKLDRMGQPRGKDKINSILGFFFRSFLDYLIGW